MSNPQNTDRPIQTDPEIPGPTDTAVDASPNGPDEESLGKIREILIGPTKRHIDQRMSGIQQRIDQSIRTSEEMITRRIESMERQFREELEGLVGELANQREEQTEAVAEAKSDLESQVKKMRDKAGSLSDKLSSVQQQIRSDLEREMESVKRDMEQNSESSLNAIVEETSRVRADLVDRETLSSLLSEVALRIGGSMESSTADPNQPDIDLDALIDQRTGGSS